MSDLQDRQMRTPGLTNAFLLSSLVVVAIWVGLAVVFHPFDSAAKILTYAVSALGVGLVGALIAAVVEVKSRNTESLLAKAPSPRLGQLVVNGAAVALLCGIAVLLFPILQTRPSISNVLLVALALLAGAGFGRYLQKRLLMKSLLPYALSFLGAFLVVLLVLLVKRIFE